MVDVLACARRISRGVQLLATVCVLTFLSLDHASARTLVSDDDDEDEDAVSISAPLVNGKQKNCLATAIYFEARGESERGQRAVADVVLARVRSPGWPKTICGVVYQGSNRKTGCQFSFTCDGLPERPRGEAWDTAKEIAAEALASRKSKPVLSNAIYFHTKHCKPRWSKKMVRVASIGSHIFYRPRRARS